MEKQVFISLSFETAEAQVLSEVMHKIIYNSNRMGFVRDFSDSQMELCRAVYRELVGDVRDKEVGISADEGQVREK